MLDGYLRRLGLEDLAGSPPSVTGLRRLHRAHAELVPYECLEIWLGRPTTVDPAESVRRILGGRGGYCFHLNGAFSALLMALGYRVTRHVGGVQTRPGQPAGVTGNHLALTVELDGPWLVDLGMGDGLHEPLPLVAGSYVQGPFRYRLRPSEAVAGGWRFDHDARGTFVRMDFDPASTTMSAFSAMHHYCPPRTNPDLSGPPASSAVMPPEPTCCAGWCSTGSRRRAAVRFSKSRTTTSPPSPTSSASPSTM